MVLPYMVTFTINIPSMLAYVSYMDPMGFTWWLIYGLILLSLGKLASGRRLADEFLGIFDVFSFAHRDFLLTPMASQKKKKRCHGRTGWQREMRKRLQETMPLTSTKWYGSCKLMFEPHLQQTGRYDEVRLLGWVSSFQFSVFPCFSRHFSRIWVDPRDRMRSWWWAYWDPPWPHTADAHDERILCDVMHIYCLS